MIFICSLTTLGAIVTTLAVRASEGVAIQGWLGYIVMGVIAVPVIFLTLSAVFDEPRTFKVPGLFIVSLVLLAGGLIAAFAVLGLLFSLIFPS